MGDFQSHLNAEKDQFFFLFRRNQILFGYDKITLFSSNLQMLCESCTSPEVWGTYIELF